MSGPYEAMWEKLNLDLDAHSGLLEVLGKFYGDIYLSQQGRLRGMEYLDFVLSEVHGLRIKELQEARAQGKKIIGTFCVFVPEEIVLADHHLLQPETTETTDEDWEDDPELADRYRLLAEINQIVGYPL